MHAAHVDGQGWNGGRVCGGEVYFHLVRAATHIGRPTQKSPDPSTDLATPWCDLLMFTSTLELNPCMRCWIGYTASSFCSGKSMPHRPGCNVQWLTLMWMDKNGGVVPFGHMQALPGKVRPGAVEGRRPAERTATPKTKPGKWWRRASHPWVTAYDATTDTDTGAPMCTWLDPWAVALAINQDPPFVRSQRSTSRLQAMEVAWNSSSKVTPTVTLSGYQLLMYVASRTAMYSGGNDRLPR
jgi:hypothetical protein